jgi:TetR/AcrR family transcriptional repressor of nem operon
MHAQSYEAVTVDELCRAANVRKSSFYHFFSSKQELALVALESQWQRIEEILLKAAYAEHLEPQEQILRLFELIFLGQQAQKKKDGYMRGCPVGNVTLEMSTLDEALRERTERMFRQWLTYCERSLSQAKAQGIVPATLDIALTAQSLLAYCEGVLLLAKSYNDPTVIQSLRTGVLSLMQYQGTSEAASVT